MANINMHYQELKHWGVVDKRFNLATVYIVHDFKFMLIRGALDKLCVALNSCNNESTGKERGSASGVSVFSDVYKILVNVLKHLKKHKKIVAIDAVVIEVVGKVLLCATMLIAEVVTHADFKCSAARKRAWLNELHEFKSRFKPLYIKASRICPIGTEAFYKGIHVEWVKLKIDATSAFLLDGIVNEFAAKGAQSFKDTTLEQLDVKATFDALVSEHDQLLRADVASKLLKMQLNKLLEVLLTHLSRHSVGEVQACIAKICKTAVSCLKAARELQTDDEETFVEQLGIFYADSSKMKLESALSCIKELLQYKPSRATLTAVIESRFKADQKRYAYFSNILSEHFAGTKRLQEAQAKRRAMFQKFQVAIIVTLFCVKMKRTACYSRDPRRKSKSVHYLDVEAYLNPLVDYNRAYAIADLKISYQVVTPEGARVNYKSTNPQEL